MQFNLLHTGNLDDLFMILPYFKEFLLQIRRQYYDNIDWPQYCKIFPKQ